MSYDFRLFLPQPGVHPLVTAQSEPDEESEEINPGPPVPEKEARKREIREKPGHSNPVRHGFCRLALEIIFTSVLLFSTFFLTFGMKAAV